MANKYHVNPATGNPGVCKAAEGNCRFGSDENHYLSKDDAHKAYELTQQLAVIPTVAKASAAKKQEMQYQVEKINRDKRTKSLEKFYASYFSEPIRPVDYFSPESLTRIEKQGKRMEESYPTKWDAYHTLLSIKEAELERAAGMYAGQHMLAPSQKVRAAGLDNYREMLEEATMARDVWNNYDKRAKRDVAQQASLYNQRRKHLNALYALHNARDLNSSKKREFMKATGLSEDSVDYVLINATRWFVGKRNSEKTLAAMAKNPQAFAPFKKMTAVQQEDIKEILLFASKYEN